jgi:hypothetical protein
MVAAALALVPAQSGAQQTPGSYQVSGRVLMSDSSKVTSAVSVELVCSGRVRRRVVPYTNGDYTIMLDEDNAPPMDLSTPPDPSNSRRVPLSGTAVAGNGEDMGRFDLSGCELRAVLPGYRSNLVSIGPRRRLDKPVVDPLVLRPIVEPDGLVFTANTLAAPRQARTTLIETWNQLQKPAPDYKRAAKELEGVVKQNASFAAAWHLLGMVRLAQKDVPAAKQAFNASIKADDTYVEPYMQLATLDAHENNWKECAALIMRVQQLNPDIPYANYLSASAHFQIGNLDVAESSALAVFDTPELERFPAIYYILGAIEAHRGNFAIATIRMQQFLQTNPEPAMAASVREMLADWEAERGVKGR